MGLNGDAFGKSELIISVFMQWRVTILGASSAFYSESRRLLTHASLLVRIRS